MDKEIFVDTSGFYALLVRADETHTTAAARMAEAARQRQRLITTDYVLDETATLLKARGLATLTQRLFTTVFASSACTVVWMDAQRFTVVTKYFEQHRDQPWSFTDCSSFCVMRERKITEALTKDRHFGQAGFVNILA
jgi:uncharacterized protein